MSKNSLVIRKGKKKFVELELACVFVFPCVGFSTIITKVELQIKSLQNGMQDNKAVLGVSSVKIIMMLG
jgi:hypothetical protein